MQYYRCKCGNRQCWGSYGPASCEYCAKCGTDIALGPNSHRSPTPHEFATPLVATDNGPVPGVTVCLLCNHSKKELLEKGLAKYNTPPTPPAPKDQEFSRW